MSEVYASASTSLSQDADFLITELLSDFVTKPLIKDTPEEVFVKYFTGDNHGKVRILVHWLRQQAQIYDRAREYNLCIASDLNVTGSLRRETYTRWARVLIENYLMATHPHWFLPASHAQMTGVRREPADMGRVIDLLLLVEAIKSEVFSKNRI